MAIKSGLLYLQVRPFTDKEWDTLPHVVMTRMEEGDSKVLDYDLETDTFSDNCLSPNVCVHCVFVMHVGMCEDVDV